MRAREQRHCRAQYNLAMCLPHGSGVARNTTAGVAHLFAAARQGHPQADFRGCSPRSRHGREPSRPECRRLTLSSTCAPGASDEEGHAAGAGCGSRAWCVKPDARRSQVLGAGGWRRHVDAQRELMRCCLNGIDGGELEAAVLWLRKAASAGGVGAGRRWCCHCNDGLAQLLLQGWTGR